MCECVSIYLNLGWRLCLSSHLTMGRATSSSSSSIDSNNHQSLSSSSSLSQLKRDLSTDLRLGLSISASQHNSSSTPRYYSMILNTLLMKSYLSSIFILHQPFVHPLRSLVTQWHYSVVTNGITQFFCYREPAFESFLLFITRTKKHKQFFFLSFQSMIIIVYAY